MRSERAWFLRLLALVSVLALVLAACGGDDDDDDAAGEGDDTTEETDAPEGEAGGEFIDGGTFVGDPPEHIDPALNTTLDAYQVINALYDGLTEIDASLTPRTRRSSRSSPSPGESNEDATVWTFTIKDGLTFSDGEPVLPSSFVRGWERASNPDFAGDYSYLFSFIDGGAEKLDGTADDALRCRRRRRRDDAHRHARSAPYSNFDRGRRLPAVLPDAVGGRRARRPDDVGERADDRQRPVHARGAPERHRDRAS